MSERATQLVAAVRDALADAGDRERVAAQQKYLRSSMPYYGISAPELRPLLKQPLAKHRLTDVGEHPGGVTVIGWPTSTYRWLAGVATGPMTSPGNDNGFGVAIDVQGERRLEHLRPRSAGQPVAAGQFREVRLR